MQKNCPQQVGPWAEIRGVTLPQRKSYSNCCLIVSTGSLVVLKKKLAGRFLAQNVPGINFLVEKQHSENSAFI